MRAPQENPAVRRFLRVDLALNAAALAAAAAVYWETREAVSFAGFGALLVLLILIPYGAASACAALFLLLAARRGRRGWLTGALVLQLLAPLPWLLISCAMQTEAAWFEALMVLQAAAGVLGLILTKTG